MREDSAYRDNLAWIDEKIPEKEMLRKSDVRRALRCSREYADKLLEGRMVQGCVSKATLARLLSGGGQ